jgi:hypothetical protein
VSEFDVRSKASQRITLLFLNPSQQARALYELSSPQPGGQERNEIYLQLSRHNEKPSTAAHQAGSPYIMNFTSPTKVIILMPGRGQGGNERPRNLRSNSRQANLSTLSWSRIPCCMKCTPMRLPRNSKSPPWSRVCASYIPNEINPPPTAQPYLLQLPSHA